MPRLTKQEQLAIIHEEALTTFREIQETMRDERKQCLEDRRFYSIPGAQWEGNLKAQFENKPRFEVNKVHLSVIRIINEYRNNRITVDFASKGGKDDDDLADFCDGLYRADEEESSADEAYDNAFEEAVGGGFGAWRLRADYVDDEDPDDEEQHICIEPIYDADTSVFFDLQAKRQDKADATSCFVLTSMTHDAYREEYGDDPSTWPKDINTTEFDWHTPDVVYIAEYFKIEEKRETIHIYQKLDGAEERYSDTELTADLIAELEAIGTVKVRQKKVKRRKVRKYIMSGKRVEEDCGYIAGTCIPIIPIYGKRWFVDNIERCMGHVRLVKDVQRLKNMLTSKLAEISAISSVEKPIFTPEQVAGHQERWRTDDVKNYPYMLVNAIMDPNGNELVSGPVGYTKSPIIPPALAALLQITEEDIKDLLGNQEQGEQVVGNIATRTIELIQNRLDMQTFIYVDNFKKAIKRCGEVWLSMARDIFVEEGRKVEIVGSQDEREYMTLMQPAIGENGETIYANDMSKAKFKVIVEVGPSSSTKRQATIRNLVTMASITDDPETKQVLGAMAMMNMEGEGIADARSFFRKKLIQMGVVEPTDDEKKKLEEEFANTPPSAQDEYLRAAAEREQSEAVKNQVEIVGEQADADKTKAETAKIISELEVQKIQQALEIIDRFVPRVQPPNVAGSTVER